MNTFRQVIGILAIHLICYASYGNNFRGSIDQDTSYVSPAGCIIQHFSIYSEEMNKDVGVVMVLPPGYNDNPDKLYPVLYTLHGKGAPYQTWSRMSPLQKALKDKPMIVTCFDGDEASYYIDAPEKGESKYTTFFFGEFIPFVDREYRTIAESKYRGITGFSLGGFGAFHYMLEKPGMFSSVSSLSGYFPDLTNEETAMKSKSLPLLIGDYAEFKERYHKLDIFNRLEKLTEKNILLPQFYLHCGTEDRLLNQNRRMRDSLNANESGCKYLETAGKHNWQFWKAASAGVVDFHWDHFNIDQDVNPSDLLNDIIKNPALKENNDGEPFAWHACNGADLFVKGYKAWHDTSWLNNAVKYYQFLMDNMKTAPDGYKGLIGRNFRNDLWANEQVSDALAINPMLEFSEMILKDPDLTVLYGDAANKYVEFAKKHVIEKWDNRDLWHEEGEYGNYIFGNDFIDPAHPDKWVYDNSARNYRMSQKFNIANKLGVTSLRLYRITGDEFYRDKAEKLFFRLKSNFQYYDDHYAWHYWVPFYEKDILFEKNDLIHWTAVHPYRAGYQASEVKQIVEAYHTGVVFSKKDIQRIINTNMEVMWNQDTVNPAFINSNGALPDVAGMSDFLNEHKTGNRAKNQGTLWSALIDFDPRVRMLYEKQVKSPNSKKAKIMRAYYYNFKKHEEPVIRRKFATDLVVTEKVVPFGNSKEITVATVIPYIITTGQKSTIVTKSDESGPIEIALFTSDGASKLRTIFKGDIVGNPDGHKGFRMIQWDGTDPDTGEQYMGEYIIRWTFKDGYRDYAIKIIESEF